MERKKASDYPQELLDIFHEYQHGEIDRRTFLDRISKVAVGGMTAAAILETLAPNYAWAGYYIYAWQIRLLEKMRYSS